MTKIEINELLGELERRIEHGDASELIMLCREGKPIAMIRYLERFEGNNSQPRPIGLAAGTFSVTPEFFDPLPDDLLAAFNCEEP